LLAVWSAIGSRLADDSGSRLELPEAGIGVDRLKQTFHSPVKGHVAGSYKSAAPNWKALLDGPDLFAFENVPRGIFAAIATALFTALRARALCARACCKGWVVRFPRKGARPAAMVILAEKAEPAQDAAKTARHLGKRQPNGL
jgi:hypothetical protein